MPAEAAYRVTVKNSKGHLYTLGADTFPEFQANLTAALGADGAGAFLSDYREAFVPAVTEQQALATVYQAFPATVAAPPVSTIGGFTPPTAPTQPVAPAGAPPTAQYPGDCAHGQRVFRDSVARGKQWQRWECALPWKSGNAEHNNSRCKAVNV